MILLADVGSLLFVGATALRLLVTLAPARGGNASHIYVKNTSEINTPSVSERYSTDIWAATASPSLTMAPMVVFCVR